MRWKTGDSCSDSRIQTETPSSTIESRNGTSPAPVGERFFADHGAHAEDHHQREEQPERRRRLDPAREEAALSLRCMLGDIGRRAAVLAAERKALQQAAARSG
jgi:hypothetical protein